MKAGWFLWETVIRWSPKQEEGGYLFDSAFTYFWQLEPVLNY